VVPLIVSGTVAFTVAVVATPMLSRWLVRHHIGQQIRDDGPQRHVVKAGTPTMGGVAIVVAVAGGYFAAHIGFAGGFTRSGILVVLVTAGAGAVGFADDMLKVRRRRSLGLSKRAKFAGQLLVAVGFGAGGMWWAHLSSQLSFTRVGELGIGLGAAGWIAWTAFALVGTANAVNLTDGLDGLASGSAAFAFSALAFIGYWEFRHPTIYHQAASYDLAIASIACAGATAGFLWWNAAPAKIFMGDTGSLAIGTAIAAIAFSMGLQLLLPILGGLYVIVTLSVIIQVVSFHLFGKRVFRMAPLHHHFELKGWPETTVIVRFWILAGLFTLSGLVAFYADYLVGKGELR